MFSLYLIIDSLLPKNDELRRLTKFTNAAVIGFSQLKFDDLFLHQKLNLMGGTSFVLRWSISEILAILEIILVIIYNI